MSTFRWLSEFEARKSGNLKWKRYPPEVLPLDVGEMDCETSSEIRKVISSASTSGQFGYGPIASRSTLPKVLSAHLEDYFGISCEEAYVIPAGGLLFALSECLRILKRTGNTLLIEPAYSGLDQAINASGCNPIRISSVHNNDGTLEIDRDMIIKEIYAGAWSIVLAIPNSPTGALLSQKDMEWLAEIAVAKNLSIFIDAIYAHTFPTPKDLGLLDILRHCVDQVVIFGGPSKAWAIPSIRVSYMIFNNQLSASRVEREFRWILSPRAALGEAVCETAVTLGLAWLQECRNKVAENKELVRSVLEPGGWTAHYSHHATPYLWLHPPLTMSYPELHFLRKAKVALVGGTMYGQPYRSFVRMNIACNQLVLKEALDRIHRVTG
ncbi:pyridoxal phosphate-dependent aminotransferase [Azospirillum cavernae]|uniref:cysteine-S-conjugate beta-lyase n=1 Tax=Azospirillum cavernae TaxID=2320860 RepID=A0A418W3B1_9PROT|nr:pyridoxal phosphate-dependent aminotransferase [Azospirillum cavernae]RJF84512.1 pyridoxal phosphate-dependent aminotransferase [Azospirillum cavernae]